MDDAPQSPPSGRPSSPAFAPYEDSPIFDFLNSLSPIATQNVQLFKSSDLASVSLTSIFTSPQESKSTIRDVQEKNELIQNAADDTQVYCADAAAGAATSHDQEMLPAVIQNQLVSNDNICDTFKVSIDGTALSQHQYDTHRRNLFNDKAGASNKSMRDISNIHRTSICGSNYPNHADHAIYASPGIGLHLNTVALNSSNIHRASICGSNYPNPADHAIYASPGIGLHLNAVALNSSNMAFTINPPLLSEQTSTPTVISGSETALCGSEVRPHVDDYSSQKTMSNADNSDQQSHKKKRRKLQNDDGESCRHCSCKKSKCLKLYCACFAAKVYCSKFCSCQGCSNNDTHEEAVSCTRKRVESRNPLAFAPTVTRTCGTVSEFRDDSNNTPASARHKRGCSCRKSSCVKKYCECFQSGVGCSMCCRCESCKNSFGKRAGVLLLTTEKLEKGGKAKGTHEVEDKLAFDKHHVVSQSDYLPASENPLATPPLEPYRSSLLLPSTCSKLPPSTVGCSSGLHIPRSPKKPDVLPPPFETCAEEMVTGTNIVKVLSPNKKRVASMYINKPLSPISSGRKLILKSVIPYFPSLTDDADSEPH